jgi:hypothetical protein
MTAIAAITFLNCPVLLGDILVSNKHPATVPIASIPTFDEPARLHRASEFQIEGLRQKICVINNNIALAWAGGMMTARSIWRALSDASASEVLCLQQVKEILDSRESDMRSDDVSVVGYVIHPEGSGSFSFQCEKTEDLKFGSAWVAGTGTGHLKAILSKLHGMEQTDEADPGEKALGMSLVLAGNLIAEELLTQATLRKFFGGGYELIMLVDNQLTKAGDVSYIWWQGEITDEGFVIGHPTRAMRLAYHDDLLLIRTLHMHAKSKEHAFDEECFVVRSLQRNKIPRDTLENLPVPDMNARYVCHLFSYQRGNELRCLVKAVVDRSDGPGIRFHLDGNELDIDLEKAFLSEVAGEILDSQL